MNYRACDRARPAARRRPPLQEAPAATDNLRVSTAGVPILMREGRFAVTRVARPAAAVPAAAMFAVVLAVSLSRNLFDPPGFDQAYYLYVTERVLAGDVEHALFWSMNAMGSYVPHALAILLFGTEPWSLRAFDACWQAATSAVLVAFMLRVSGRWTPAWTAAALYAAAYYGGGYIHTAQREGFAVLPLLVMAWAVVASGDGRVAGGLRRRAVLHLLAGVAGLFAFSLKPTLGLCFGVLWLLVLAEAWNRRRTGARAFLPPAMLTAGFAGAAALGAVGLLHTGLWPSLSGALTLGAQVPDGYVQGAALARRLAGPLAAALLPAALLAWRITRAGPPSSPGSRAGRWLRLTAGAVAVVGLLLLPAHWPEAREPLWSTAGLLLPAVGAVLRGAGGGPARGRRVCGWMSAAAFGGVLVQGWFFLYHMLPLLAFAACLAALELDEGFQRVRAGDRRLSGWWIACCGAVLHLLIGFWGGTMTRFSDRPLVLSGTDLAGHYERVTRPKTRYPHYGTSMRVAERIRALTRPDEPIALLFREPRIYHLAHRPPVHPLLVINEWTAPLFEGFMEAIAVRRPRVVVARVPEPARSLRDAAAIQEALLADIESFFGPPGRAIRQAYRLSEVIDDVAILERTSPALR